MFQWELTSRGVAQSDRDKQIRNDVNYYAVTGLIKYFGELNIVNLNSFTLQRYILENFVRMSLNVPFALIDSHVSEKIELLH